MWSYTVFLWEIILSILYSTAQFCSSKAMCTVKIYS